MQATQRRAEAPHFLWDSRQIEKQDGVVLLQTQCSSVLTRLTWLPRWHDLTAMETERTIRPKAASWDGRYSGTLIIEAGSVGQQ